jgi:hypothetical protein
MRFRLARMSPALAVLTWLLLVVPIALLYSSFTFPSPASSVLFATVGFFILVYASVYFVWRPTRFEVSPDALRIVWPVRQRSILMSAVEDVKLVTAKEFRKEHGYGMRIGAGGLFGAFGLLRCGTVTFSLWISRTDWYVMVKLRNDRPLLITPANPERFVDLVTRSATSASAAAASSKSAAKKAPTPTEQQSLST